MDKKLTIGIIVLLILGVSGTTYFIAQDDIDAGYQAYSCDDKVMLCWKLSGGSHTWCYDDVNDTKSHTTCGAGWELYKDIIIGEATDDLSILDDTDTIVYTKHKYIEKDKKEAEKKQAELDKKYKEEFDNASISWSSSEVICDLNERCELDIDMNYTMEGVRYNEILTFKIPFNQTKEQTEVFIESRVNKEIELRITKDDVYYKIEEGE